MTTQGQERIGVLVLDDRIFSDLELSSLLVPEKSKVDVFKARTVEEAVKMLETGNVKVALVDRDLPRTRGGGIGFLREHTPKFTNVRFYGVTDTYDEGFRKELEDARAFGYISRRDVSARDFFLYVVGYNTLTTDEILGMSPVINF